MRGGGVEDADDGSLGGEGDLSCGRLGSWSFLAARWLEEEGLLDERADGALLVTA